MNDTAQRHLAKAKDYLAKGDQFYRKAKPEIESAIASGASQREVARYLARGRTWVQDVLAWDGAGTLYGNDTARRQNDAAKQVLREAPLEQVEQMIATLPQERQQQIAAAAGNRYAQARQEYAENERNLTERERQERENAKDAITKPAREAAAGFTALGIVGHIEQATDELRELVADDSVTDFLLERIAHADAAWRNELEVARGMAGLKAH